MKTKKQYQKALTLYINNVPIYHIASQMHMGKQVIYDWKRKYEWDNLRNDTIQKQSENLTDKIIDKQILIVTEAQKQLNDKLKKQDEIIEQIGELHSQIKVLNPKEDKEDRLELYSMMNALVKQLLETKDLINIMKHGLNVVRPTEHVSNLNITKTDNKIIQVNIPKEVQELINMENTNGGKNNGK